MPRLHQSTNIKQDLLLCKNNIYPEWKHLWVSFLLSILVRKFGLTFRKNWNHLRVIHLAKNIKCPTIVSDFLLIFVLYACHILFDFRFICLSHSVDLRFIFLSHSVILRWCHYFPPIYPYSCSPHPLYIGMLFSTVFCCCVYAYFTWRSFDAFCYFYYYL